VRGVASPAADPERSLRTAGPVFLRHPRRGGTLYGAPSPALGATGEIGGVKSKTYDGDSDGELFGANGATGMVNQQYHTGIDSNGDIITTVVYNINGDFAVDIPAKIEIPFTLKFYADDVGYGVVDFCDGVNETCAELNPTALTYSIVPEPSTWAMMLVGFAGLAFGSCAPGQRRTELLRPQNLSLT